MKTLQHIKCGWKWAQDTWNELIDAINERSVSVSLGGGLDIQESPNGCVLNASRGASTPTATDSGLTADQLALLAALATDPGINGTYAPTVPPTDHSHDTVNGPIEFIPWKPGATTGLRLITYLSTIEVDGLAVNTLYSVWTWAGQPFNAHACDGNTF